MPTRTQVCAWIAGFTVFVPWVAVARTEQELLDLIVRDGCSRRTTSVSARIARALGVVPILYERFGRPARPDGAPTSVQRALR